MEKQLRELRELIPDPESEGYCESCGSRLELAKVGEAYKFKHLPHCWYTKVQALLAVSPAQQPVPEGATKFVTAEMVQESVGKFGADLPWCRTVANRLNGLLAASTPTSRLSEEQVPSWLVGFHDVPVGGNMCVSAFGKIPDELKPPTAERGTSEAGKAEEQG